MASRRDELNAYNFARKRTVAAFLKPLPNGSVESAPRPVRTVVPTAVLGLLIIVGFGGCGLIKPAAPAGWNNPGEKVIVGDKSTTRYVVLNSKEKDEQGNSKRLLHPVLNLASARLLLDPSKFEVVKVKESVLDGDDAPPHGPTIGIPYAPDRLPESKDAAAKKTWALCEQPGGGADSRVQRALFVFANKDEQRAKVTDAGKGRLNKRGSLYVKDPDGAEWLVDHLGVAHQLDATFPERMLRQDVDRRERQRLDGLLRGILFGQETAPQAVTEEWMNTLIKSPLPLFFPPVKDAGQPSSTTGVPAEHRTNGKIIEANGEFYVVLDDGVAPVSPFAAKLLLEGPVGGAVYQNEAPEPVKLPLASITVDQPRFMGELNGRQVPWPREETTRTNTHEQSDGRRVVCSVYYGGNRTIPGLGTETDVREMSTWAGRGYPAPIVDGSGSTYVTPGSGLLYKEVTGKAKDGSLFLVTDTGLRYSVQVNNDSADTSGSADNEQNKAQIRLGYGDIAAPPLVPREWSRLLSAGPSLNTEAARQPQGS
ncbi:type VII secretion protein EccB [Streptomyces sp. OF3]|uniref:Type VII secretion protein EccB n=1 Tax=Streptomyces alkaliterrae TaxID=2213162 RepID=A0A7W3WJY5_9ACTN|nr:type VII secretion protein EccB [Streptomyces alkaliterrae]MBB1253758.1 type VII secretion protein EccB [Streptomyces alkaliterrae]